MNDSSCLAQDMGMGYKSTLPETDALVVDRLLYHGRLGGVIEEFQSSPMYFYAEGELSSVFAEHIFLNGDDTYKKAAIAADDGKFLDAYIEHAPTVCVCRVTIERPAILDMARLRDIANALGIAEAEQDKFVADFEDSDPNVRERVFAWARSSGHTGAIIVNDMTPEFAGGDWCFRTSYVAFAPTTQVRFAFQ